MGTAINFKEWLAQTIEDEDAAAAATADEEQAEYYSYVNRWNRLMAAFDTFFPDLDCRLRYRIRPGARNWYTPDGGIA